MSRKKKKEEKEEQQGKREISKVCGHRKPKSVRVGVQQ